MFSDLQLKLTKSLEEDENSQNTCESVLKWLSDSSVHPRHKVNSFQWFHIHTLLANNIQSNQDEQPPTEQTNQPLSSLLQLILSILEECFDSHTPIPNKRLLHTSLSHLAQSPSLPSSALRNIDFCLTSLKHVDEGTFLVVEKTTMDSTQTSFDNLQRQYDQLQHDHDQQRSELANKTQKLEENERNLTQTQQTIEEMKAEIARLQPIVASEVIVVFNPDLIRVNRSTVTRINCTGHADGFTKVLSKGIHRLSIRTYATSVMIGVMDAAEYPNFLRSGAYTSPKAADLEKRTLHFFIDGTQLEHHFIDIPVPLVFAIDVFNQDIPTEITFWGENQESQATSQGTGHNLG
ncbi:hypothetical protein BLNAU_12426 [Blattamonas nauphoetae]|uniref:Uncharacterized protein n=1 Tax=Blattamonas nauphoetae TaxID=2049346 RepID=A0ABQ9XJJ2_9EUKA|nr:hypothetical protein BLNAU_12426 [Blattamonas nauphoetae]